MRVSNGLKEGDLLPYVLLGNVFFKHPVIEYPLGVATFLLADCNETNN